MNSYQDLILDRLEELAYAGEELPLRTVSVSHDFGNRGRLMVTRDHTFATIATADFDFQSERVHILLNNPGGPRSMMTGPRSDTTYWWTVGNPEDDAEVNRLLVTWRELVQKGLK